MDIDIWVETPHQPEWTATGGENQSDGLVSIVLPFERRMMPDHALSTAVGASRIAVSPSASSSRSLSGVNSGKTMTRCGSES